MDIIWHGYNCIELKTKNAAAIINPYKDNAGLKLPPLKGNILITTGNDPDNNNEKAVEGEVNKLDWPGEYEIKELAITAGKSPENGSLYLTLVGENIKVAYMENMGKTFNDELLESIGDVDVLIISIGGDKGMDAAAAHKAIEEIEPRCVIPMNYKLGDTTKDLAELEPFLKLVGGPMPEPIDKLTVTNKSQFREDAMETVILRPIIGT